MYDYYELKGNAHMTPREQELIQGVADRLRNTNLTEKDSDAESLIKTEIGDQPNSTYILTQAVILQEQALKQAQTQIEILKKRVEQARQESERAPHRSPGASFLGGFFSGDGRQQSVAPSSRPKDGTVQRDPWGKQGAASRATSGAGGGFGGFMRGAASVALGVAGGHLLADALQDMLGVKEEGEEQLVEQGSAESASMVAESEDTGDGYSKNDELPAADDYDSDAGFEIGDDDWG